MPTPAQRLAQGVAHHRAGRLAEAEQAYRDVLALQPKQADAWHLLGVIALGHGQPAAAVERIERARSLGLDNASLACNLGAAYAALGQPDDARASYQRALELDPRQPDAWFNLGNLEHRRGDTKAAEHAFRAALSIDSKRPPTWNNLGNLLREQGDLAAAAECYERATALNPGTWNSWFNLGLTRQQQHESVAAIAAFEHALLLQPDHVESRYRLARALDAAGRLAAAHEQLTRVVAERPDWSEAFNALGVNRQRRNDLDGALDAFRRAVELQPRLIEGWCNLAVIHQLAGRWDDSIHEGLEPALRLDPGCVLARRLLAQVLLERGRFDEAQTHWQAALEAAPSGPQRDLLSLTAALAPPAIFTSREQIDQLWKGAVAEIERLTACGAPLDLPTPPFYLGTFYWAYAGRDVCPLLTSVARLFRQAVPALNFQAPHAATRRTSPGRRRLGFISRYFLDHSVGRMIEGVLRELPRDRFETILFRIGSSESDPVAQRIDQVVDRVVSVDTNLHVLQRQVAAEQLDALLFTDVGMDMLTGWLAYARLAPVQAVFAGHPVTTGLDTIDYYLSCHAFEPPGAESHYRERLVRLPLPPIYFYRPSRPATFDRASTGLDNQDRLYLCAQTLFKVHPDFDDLLRAILKRDPRAVPVFFESPDSTWGTRLRKRWQGSIGPLAERIRVIPRVSTSDYLRWLELADVVLDTLHFSGGTTALDAIALGVPVVTWPGAFMRGRTTAGLLELIGVTDTIAVDFDDYVERAVQVANDPVRRADIRRKLLANHAILYENRQAVVGLSAFLEQVV